MHTIVTTTGFIIDSRPYGEAGKMLSIFTRELGLISATAQGIRLEKSKLRYHAQLYSFGTFSFVRGKEYWRMTSANHDSTIQLFNYSKIGYELIARIALLLRRLLHGEEPHSQLFECVESCIKFLNECLGTNEEQLKSLEALTVFRILHALGYVGKDAKLNDLLNSNTTAIEFLDSLVSKRSDIVKHINKALKESHL